MRVACYLCCNDRSSSASTIKFPLGERSRADMVMTVISLILETGVRRSVFMSKKQNVLTRTSKSDSNLWVVRGWNRPPVCHSSKKYSSDQRAQNALLIVVSWLIGGAIICAPCASAQDPATVGQWSAKTTWPYRAVHAALLPTGKV